MTVQVEIDEGRVKEVMEYLQTNRRYSMMGYIESIGYGKDKERTARGYKIGCPFHSDSSPSFYIDDSTQVFKCFGCDRGGPILIMAFHYARVIQGRKVNLAHVADSFLREDPLMKSHLKFTSVFVKKERDLSVIRPYNT